MPLSLIDVAAVVLRRQDGKVLLAERRKNQIAGGYWELPGGKIEPGETAEQAAIREVAEEVGVVARGLRRGPVQEFDFPTKRVRLNIFFASEWTGEPQGRERQRVAWFDPEHPTGPVLPSNVRILAALGLPPILAVVKASRQMSTAQILDQSAEALANGAGAIQFRASYLSPDQQVGLARRVTQRAHAFGARVFLVGTAIEANRAGVDGLHSTASQLHLLYERPQTALWSASCHDDRDFEQAVRLGADFIVASPILPSPSHPETAGLGWQRLKQIAEASPVPVYAQGGMSLTALDAAQANGAVGIAMAAQSIGDQRRKAA